MPGTFWAVKHRSDNETVKKMILESSLFITYFKNLELAYAITVHKSQGSEYKFVLLPVVSSYGHMLQKNLLYTGITRAKKRLWLFYEQEALIRAVDPNSVVYRYTSLAKHLIAE
ncbi:ATP-binding domain-containing protein [Neobacillus drentensis]|uniref:ATP-binding domain-containing protein n=1 Tax=Neobacillus drentensis TaxID=220684 RepID=UPI0008252FE5|nr:ATP-binding domain-containing protein [Neobacillus drentensis]